MSALNSPPGGNALSACGRQIAIALLTLVIGAAWLLTEAGAHLFDAGERLETGARRCRTRLRD